MIHKLLCAAVLATAGAAGCSTMPIHAALAPLPRADALESERRAWYDAHRPTVVRVPMTDAGSEVLQYVLLKDGQRVQNPEDLLAHVPASSSTARAIVAAAQARSASGPWATVGSVGAAFGAAIAVTGGVAALSLFDGTMPANGAALIGVTSLATGTLLSGVGLFGVWYGLDKQRQATEQTRRALLSYDDDLRQQLQLTDARRLPKPNVADLAGDIMFEGSPR